MSIPLADFTEPQRFNGKGQYQVVTPEGKKLSCTRWSTIADQWGDTFGLSTHKARAVAIGIAKRPDLASIAATLTIEDKDELGQIIDAAAEVGGASTKANLGTLRHRYCEMLDAGGRAPDNLDELSDEERSGWRDALAYATRMADLGLERVEEWTEFVCVHEQAKAAGTCDGLWRATKDIPECNITIGDLLIGDVKSGSLAYGWHKMPAQIAFYRQCDYIYRHASRTCEQLPDELRWDIGLIIHVPRDEARCHVYTVDLVAGWVTASGLLSLRREHGDAKARWQLISGLTTAPDGVPVADDTPDLTPRFNALAERLAALKGDPLVAKRVAEAWPKHVPSMKAGVAAHTAGTLDTIEALLVSHLPVERPAPAPADDVDDMIARLERLPSDIMADVRVVAKEAGVPNLRTGRATPEHLALLARTLVSAELRHAERVAPLVQLLSEADMDPTALLDTVGAPDADTPEARVAMLDALAAERLTALVEGSVMDLSPEALERACGGKRPLLTKAKELAELHGLPAPKASGDVEGVLAALTLRAAVA